MNDLEITFRQSLEVLLLPAGASLTLVFMHGIGASMLMTLRL